jgi:hypothetical protein
VDQPARYSGGKVADDHPHPCGHEDHGYKTHMDSLGRAHSIADLTDAGS